MSASPHLSKCECECEHECECECVGVSVCVESGSVPSKLLTCLRCGLILLKNCLGIAATVTFLKPRSGHAGAPLSYPQGSF